MLKGNERPDYSRLEQAGIYVGERVLYVLGRAGEAADKVPGLSRLLFGPRMSDVYRSQQPKRN